MGSPGKSVEEVDPQDRVSLCPFLSVSSLHCRNPFRSEALELLVS